jgi:hypothetical protein
MRVYAFALSNREMTASFPLDMQCILHKFHVRKLFGDKAAFARTEIALLPIIKFLVALCDELIGNGIIRA